MTLSPVSGDGRWGGGGLPLLNLYERVAERWQSPDIRGGYKAVGTLADLCQ